jgi:hypothetical protein
MRTKIARLFIVLCLGWMVACDSNTNGPFKPVSEEPALIDRRVSTPEVLILGRTKLTG